MKERLIIFISLILLSSLLIGYISFYFNSSDDGTREKIIIESLLSKGYIFVLPKDYFANPNKYNKTALMIHDADFSNKGFNTFIKIESEYGIKSAFYPRVDVDWFSTEINNYKLAENNGWEIGFQYDCLSRANGNYSLAYNIFYGQLSYIRSLFNVSTTDYHGDSYNFNILNLNLYDKEIWSNLGLNEVYSLQNYSYYSDSNNRLISPQESLKDLVIVQLHTDWTR